MNVKSSRVPSPGQTVARGVAGLTAASRQLQRETARRQAAESALKESRQHYRRLLAQSKLMQEQLRHLSHQALRIQEEERKRISRELHDEISQILTGINVRLATLKIEAAANNIALQKRIVSTQRLVEKSVAAVHRFARELRPAMLDDLGLLPALIAYLKEFGKRTGIQVRFTSVTADKLAPLSSLKRTMLYRVAQEALTNVARHAQASQAAVSLQLHQNALCLEIIDNGMSFDVPRVIATKRRRHLGIIGMRERTEMLGGTFEIESAPGEGTTVRVQIRLHNGTDKTAPRRQAGGARCPRSCPNHDNPPSMIGKSP